MSSNLVPVGGSLIPSRSDRRVGRQLSEIRSNQLVATANVASRLDFLADVTEMGMSCVSHISAVEGMLAAQNPAASARLAAVADLGCMAAAETVLRANRSLR